MGAKKVAIVTGASSGIGMTFAQKLSHASVMSRRKKENIISEGSDKISSFSQYNQYRDEYIIDEIWLVARRRDRLRELSAGIEEKYGVKTHVVTCDLSQHEQVESLHEKLESESPYVTWLINAAGWGEFAPVNGESLGNIRSMIEVNDIAMSQLCAMVAPYMKEQVDSTRTSHRSHIINMASAVSFLPTPGASVYAASKSFTLHFSYALGYELRPHITVTAVCPKAVRTEFFQHVDAGLHKTSLEDRVKKFGLEEPNQVVIQALKDAVKGKAVSASSLDTRLLQLAYHTMPTRLLMDFCHLYGLIDAPGFSH